MRKLTFGLLALASLALFSADASARGHRRHGGCSGGGCACGVNCPAGGGCAGACPCTQPQPVTVAGDYAGQYRSAVEEQRPLVTWIGLSCPACEAKLAGCKHAHVPAGSLPGFVREGFALSMPTADGLRVVREGEGLPDVGALQRLVMAAGAGEQTARLGR